MSSNLNCIFCESKLIETHINFDSYICSNNDCQLEFCLSDDNDKTIEYLAYNKDFYIYFEKSGIYSPKGIYINDKTFPFIEIKYGELLDYINKLTKLESFI